MLKDVSLILRMAWSIGGVQVYLCYRDTSTTINIKPIRSHAGSFPLNNCANLHAAGVTMVTAKPLPVQIRRESSYLPHTTDNLPSRGHWVNSVSPSHAIIRGEKKISHCWTAGAKVFLGIFMQHKFPAGFSQVKKPGEPGEETRQTR